MQLKPARKRADIDAQNEAEYNKSMRACEKLKKAIKYFVFCFAAVGCALLFGGCHIYKTLPVQDEEFSEQ